jgi:hypothetical protein
MPPRYPDPRRGQTLGGDFFVQVTSCRLCIGSKNFVAAASYAAPERRTYP